MLCHTFKHSVTAGLGSGCATAHTGKLRHLLMVVVVARLTAADDGLPSTFRSAHMVVRQLFRESPCLSSLAGDLGGWTLGSAL